MQMPRIGLHVVGCNNQPVQHVEEGILDHKLASIRDLSDEVASSSRVPHGLLAGDQTLQRIPLAVITPVNIRRTRQPQR